MPCPAESKLAPAVVGDNTARSTGAASCSAICVCTGSDVPDQLGAVRVSTSEQPRHQHPKKPCEGFDDKPSGVARPGSTNGLCFILASRGRGVEESFL